VKKPKAGQASIALSVSLGEDGHTPPSEFRIFRSGANASEKGVFLFDETAAETVMANYAAHGKTLRIDFNHGTTFANPTPEMAIAAGSFGPEVRNGELWACSVSWTPRAAEYLRNGEYTEMSPLFNHDDSGRVLWLRNVALTNLPALDHTAPLIAANANEGDDTMESCKACSAKDEALSAKDAALAAMTARLSAFEKKEPDGDDKLSAALRADVIALTGANITSTTDIAAAKGIVLRWKEDAAKVPALEAKLSAIETAKHDAEFKAMLDGANTDLKIMPGQNAFWEGQCKRDGHATEAGVAMLRAFLGTAVKLASDTATTQKRTAGEVLTDVEKQAAKMSGWTVAEATKARKELLDRQAANE
jgi:phage I-like protein